MATNVKLLDPTFETHRPKKEDHFPVTVFKPSLRKTTEKSKVAQILRPENGHVSGTEKSEKCAHALPDPMTFGVVFR